MSSVKKPRPPATDTSRPRKRNTSPFRSPLAEWPDWKAYENQLRHQLAAALPDATVTFDKRGKQKLPGRYSRIGRQIDVLVKGAIIVNGASIAQTVIVDCKCMNRRVDVKAVEEFIGLLEDVGAAFGLLVTTKGFSKAAARRATAAHAVLCLVPLDEVRLWKLRNVTVSYTYGAGYGFVHFHDKDGAQGRFIDAKVAVELLSQLK